MVIITFQPNCHPDSVIHRFPSVITQVPASPVHAASSRDETFFEASPWLDSDCEDDFFSVNGGNGVNSHDP